MEDSCKIGSKHLDFLTFSYNKQHIVLDKLVCILDIHQFGGHIDNNQVLSLNMDGHKCVISSFKMIQFKSTATFMNMNAQCYD